MSNLITAQDLTMSSLDIANLVGSRHDKVKQSIERLSDRGVIQLPPMGRVQKEQSVSNNKFSHAYLFMGESGKRDSIVVVAQLSPEFTARLVDRWQELEQQVIQQTIPQTYPDALRLAAELAEETQRLTLVTKEQQAEIKDLKNLFKDGMTPTQFCKILNGVNTQQVNHWLAERNWLYNESKSGTRWRATSYVRDRYLTEHQSKISVHGGEDFIKYQPVLLQKGAERIYTLYRKGSLPMKVNWDGNYTHQKEISLAS